jgi:uncharacterized membrane protein YdjX (TVP38/TMEM64 family)
MPPSRYRNILLLGAVLLLAAAAFLYFDLGALAGIGSLKAHFRTLAGWAEERPLLAAACFFLAYAAALTLCIPGAVLSLSLLAGALFGHVLGIPLVAAATALGSMGPFLLARYVARDWVRGRLAPAFEARPHDEAGDALFLLGLRLMAVVPYFAVNPGMGLTRIRLRSFLLVTLVGVIPSTAVYVHAGTQLPQIDSMADVLSPGVITAFVLLGAFPLLVRLVSRSPRLRKQNKARQDSSLHEGLVEAEERASRDGE